MSNTTRTRAKGNTPYKQLAEQISAILSNPLTPPRLYCAIMDEIVEWQGDYLKAEEESSDFIEKCLFHFQRGKVRRI